MTEIKDTIQQALDLIKSGIALPDEFERQTIAKLEWALAHFDDPAPDTPFELTTKDHEAFERLYATQDWKDIGRARAIWFCALKYERNRLSTLLPGKS